MVVNCVISGNVAERGGGIYDCDGPIINCTITDNSATFEGGGLYSCNGPISNCIIWNNNPEPLVSCSQPTYSCLAGVGAEPTNIFDDPRFAFADDYHLRPDSPCIDAGDNTAVPLGVVADPDGNPRFYDAVSKPDTGNGAPPVVDIGAYEYNDEVAPRIAAWPHSFRFLHFEGDSGPLESVLSIVNAGGQTLNWSICNKPSWLPCTPLSGISTSDIDEVTLSVSVEGLDSGVYTGDLEVCDTYASNGSLAIETSLTVGTSLFVPAQYPTIQAAIGAAQDGDTVVVDSGTYYENINFLGKAIRVRSQTPGDWATITSTIIDGGGLASCVTFSNGEGAESALEGFTVTNGIGTDINFDKYGGGIICQDSSPTIKRCLIMGNDGDHGAGVALLGQCQAWIGGCIIVGNGDNPNSAVMIHSEAPETASSVIINCTVAANPGSRYQVDAEDTQAVISNTILWDYSGRGLRIVDPSLVTYCCVSSTRIFGNESAPYDLAGQGGNISEAPRFIQPYGEPEKLDYHLRLDSACVNAGDPNPAEEDILDIDGQSRVMGGRMDIGADEVTPVITVERPSEGDVWIKGSTHQIKWSSYGISGMVTIRYSSDNGAGWIEIEDNVADTGEFMWLLPDNLASDQCLVSVMPSVPDAQVICEDSGLFTIQADFVHPPVTAKWQTLGGNFKRSGLSADYGPGRGCIKWQFEVPAAVSASAAVGAGGRVHISCENGSLYTLNGGDGWPIWTYDAFSPLISSPTVGQDGSLYVGTEDGRLHAVSIAGTVRWTYTAGSAISSSPAVGSDATVYVCSQDGILYALGHDGSELWSFRTGGRGAGKGAIFSSPAVAEDGTVYISGLYDPNLYALDPLDGSVKWACSFEFPDPCDSNHVTFGWPFASPVVGQDGTVYQTLVYDSHLYAIEPVGGTIAWSANLADPGAAWFDPGYMESWLHTGGWSEPVLGADGTIYASLNDPYLRAVNTDGSIKWVVRLGVVGSFTLTVGQDGLVYAACDDGHVYVVSPAGKEMSRFWTSDWLNHPVMPANRMLLVADGEDTTMLVGDETNTVWAISSDGCESQQLDLHRPQDIDGSRVVNYMDLAHVATDWLECTDPDDGGVCGPIDSIYLTGDINRDLYVELRDFAELAGRWLDAE
jgi:outer membrane protein assembly factor BamB